MHFNMKVLGFSAFVSYFGLDALTTCIAIFLFGVAAESNPAMFLAMCMGGIIGFLASKFILSLCLVVPSFLLAARPETKAVGEGALMAIFAGGALAAINNIQVLMTGTSLLSRIYYQNSYVGPGLIVTVLMFLIGLGTYILVYLKDRKLRIRAHL